LPFVRPKKSSGGGKTLENPPQKEELKFRKKKLEVKRKKQNVNQLTVKRFWERKEKKTQ